MTAGHLAFQNTAELTHRLQNLGDPLAEAVVRRLRELKIGVMNAMPEIQRQAQSGDEACSAFLQDALDVPAWVDFDLINEGAQASCRNFISYAVAMLFGPLVRTYTYPPAAETLASTGRLETDFRRRSAESAQLFMGIFEKDSLQPHAPIWTLCVHVRLLHAMVRLRVLESGKWTFPDEIPINQKELCVSSWLFGTFSCQAMERMGGVLTAREKEGHYMLWRYVCRLEGATAEGCLADADDQRNLESRLIGQINEDGLRYHKAAYREPGLTSQRLGEALMNSVVSKALPRGLLAAVVLRLHGKDVTKYALRIQPSWFWVALLGVAVTGLRCLNFATAYVPGLKGGASRFWRDRVLKQMAIMRARH